MKYAMTTFMTVVMMTSMILFINVKISKSQDSGNGNDNSCMYKVDGMGVTYDVSQLKMEGFDYKIYGGDLPCTPEKEDNYTYTFNFCGPIHRPKQFDPSCNIQDASVLQESIDGACRVAGRFNKQRFDLIDANDPALGVMVEYGGGDVCHTRAGFARVTKIYAYCDPEGRSYSKDVVDEPDGPKACEYEIKFHSSAACPSECPIGEGRKPCNGKGHCAYDHTNKKARCFCNTGFGGLGCTEDVKEVEGISSTMMGLLVTVLILTIGLAGVLGFMIYKIKKARDQSSSYFKIQGTEMLNSQI